jgi:hypothetical protein
VLFAPPTGSTASSTHLTLMGRCTPWRLETDSWDYIRLPPESPDFGWSTTRTSTARSTGSLWLQGSSLSTSSPSSFWPLAVSPKVDWTANSSHIIPTDTTQATMREASVPALLCRHSNRTTISSRRIGSMTQPAWPTEQPTSHHLESLVLPLEP